MSSCFWFADDDPLETTDELFEDADEVVVLVFVL